MLEPSTLELYHPLNTMRRRNTVASGNMNWRAICFIFALGLGIHRVDADINIGYGVFRGEEWGAIMPNYTAGKNVSGTKVEASINLYAP